MSKLAHMSIILLIDKQKRTFYSDKFDDVIELQKRGYFMSERSCGVWDGEIIVDFYTTTVYTKNVSTDLKKVI